MYIILYAILRYSVKKKYLKNDVVTKQCWLEASCCLE